jgi:chromosome partitioning protein
MIVTVTSFKGGVGKTTTAIHLATFLQGQAETVLIDADPNRSALSWEHRGDLPFPVVDEWSREVNLEAFQHIVIDTQARPTQSDLALLASHCDWLVLPTTSDILAVDALFLTVEYLRTLPTAQFCVLLTAVSPTPNKAEKEVRSRLKQHNIPVFRQGIRRYSAFSKAAATGVPVYAVKDAKAEAAWQDYEAVGYELLNLANPGASQFCNE